MTTRWERFVSANPDQPAYVVGRLGYWGTHPFREGEVSDQGLDWVYCFQPFQEIEALTIAKDLHGRGMSAVVLRIDDPTKVDGDVRLAWGATRVLVLEQQRQLAPGIVLFPDRASGEEIECDARHAKQAEKLAASRAWEIDDMPGVRPIAPVRTVRVVVK